MAAKKKKSDPDTSGEEQDTKAVIAALIKETNARLERSGSLGKVYRGNEIRYVECERLTSGSLGLDIIMGGGLPKSRFTEYYGEESAGKTTMSATAVAENQMINPKINIGIAAAEGFAKDWWRTNRVYLPYSEDEFENAGTDEIIDAMTEYNSVASEYGEIVVQQILAGDKLLEEAVRYIKTGVFDFFVIDSFGALRPTNSIDEDDEKYREVGDDEMGGNAKMFARFCGKLDSAFNMRGVNGKENKTCLIGINQVRAKIGGWSPAGGAPPGPTGGHALKHTKSISIEFSKGPKLKRASGTRETIYGGVVRARCMKNKTARPHRDCEFPFVFFEDAGMSIGVDKATEIAEHGVYYGIFDQSGAFYSYNGEKIAQGKNNLADFLRERPEFMAEVTPEIMRLSK